MSQNSTGYSTPGWVKIFGIILIVLVLLVGIMLITGGDHGPGRHLPSGNHNNNATEEHIPPANHGGQ